MFGKVEGTEMAPGRWKLSALYVGSPVPLNSEDYSSVGSITEETGTQSNLTDTTIAKIV